MRQNAKECKMKYEKKLQEIVKKFQIETELGYKLKTYDIFADIIYQEWLKYDSIKKTAIYGAGIHTEELLKVIKLKHGLVCVIDNHSEEKIKYGVPVIPVSKIVEKDIELVIISSYKHREQMKQDLNHYNPNIKILDFYDVILQKNIHINSVFYDIGEFQKYLLTNQTLIKYKQENQVEKKQYYLQDLISCYIAIRDFIRSKIYIEKYIQKEYQDYKRYEQFLLQLQELLKGMRIQLKNREKEDVVIFLVDALKQQEIKNMKFLSKLASDQFVYENYISEYPATRQTLLALLTGWKNLDDKLYEKDYLKWNDSQLLQYMNQNNYSFRYIGNTRTSPYTFLNEEKRMRANLTTPENLWYGINELMEDEKNAVYILHTDAEIHPPHFSPDWEKPLQLPNDKWTYQELQEQYYGAVSYVDDILKFYYELVEQKNGTYIVMGDHGLNLELEYDISHKKQKAKIGYWGIEDLNTALIIASREFGKGICKGVLTTADFHKILLSILKKDVNNCKEIKEEQAILQFLPSYNKRWTKVLIQSGNYEIAKGLIGLWNQQETYLLFEDDSEMYFSSIDNKQENLIENTNYQDNIKKCRETLGRKFPKEVLGDRRFELHNKLLKEYYDSMKTEEK